MTQIHSPGSTEHDSFTGRPINGKLLLTVSEAAAALRISRSSIYRLFEARELAWVQIAARASISPTATTRSGHDDNVWFDDA